MTLDEAGERLAAISGRPLRPYSTRDFGRDQYPEGRSVVVDDDSEVARRVLAKVRAELGPGLYAFIGCTRSLKTGAEAGSEIVVATGKSQFDILEVAQSDAVNYDMETKDLVRKLQEYDRLYGIDVFHAETDTIEFTFKKLPPDLSEFCRNLYEFCPDIVDQGVGSVENLERQIAETSEVYLWWD